MYEENVYSIIYGQELNVWEEYIMIYVYEPNVCSMGMSQMYKQNVPLMIHGDDLNE